MTKIFNFSIKKFNPLPGLKPQELVGIDMSTDTLKIVAGKFFGNRLEVTDIVSQTIAGMPEDEISKVIRSSFGGLRLVKPYIIDVIPAHLVITKNIEIPSINPHEIKEIINLQAGRHTPYSREEIIVDYIDIGTYRRSYTKILLVIVARNAIRRQSQILERAGIPMEKVLLASEGLSWSSLKILKLDTAIFPGSIIHIDQNFTDFSIIFKEKVIFIRSIPIGSIHLNLEREKYQTKFAEEIKRSLEAYQNEDIERVPQSVVVTGAVENLDYLEPVLNETLRLTVKLIPYLKNMAIREQLLAVISAAKGVSFLNVIAPLWGWKELRVDLIPDEIKLRRAIEQRGKDLIKTGISMLVIFLLLFLILLSKIHFKNIYLKKLATQYSALDPEAKKLEEASSKVRLIKSYLTKRGYPLEVLTELHALLPLELELSDIRFDEQGKFSIKGTAESMSAVFAFIDSMEKSKHFKDVKTKYTTKRKEGLRDVTDFEITCILQKENS